MVKGRSKVLVEMKCGSINLFFGNGFYPEMAQLVVEEVQRHDNWIEWVWLQSFHDRYLLECRALHSEVILHKLVGLHFDLYFIGPLFMDLDGFHASPLVKGEYIEKGKVSSVNVVHFSITQAMVNQIHEAGLTIFAWTVDDPAVAKNLIDMGVDGIISNCPQLLLTKE